MSDIAMEPPRTPPPGKSQPIDQVAPSSGPELDDAAVRAAIASAEANNQDPMTIKTSELASQAPVLNQPTKVEVPEKFLKPDGVVDVEKIQASTRQLDEAIAKKEEAVSKTVDDYMREYNERQTKFRTLPNPERLAAQVPPPIVSPTPAPVAEVAPNVFDEIVRRDYAADPLGTTTRLLDLMLQKKFQPIEEREQAQKTRENLTSLASKDSRILREDVFAAVNAKLQADPDLWKLKNPHKAAWLEVKEEMRLGEPTQAQAQPSRPSPVLSGGTPPSAPSASVNSPQNVIGSLHTLDLRDKKQEEAGDEAIRALLANDRG